jgi:hypothetical protein
MSSIAQQANPMGMGHMELVLTQLITASARETTTSPSILLLYVSSVLAVTMDALDARWKQSTRT